MKEAKQEQTYREERITSQDRCFQPLDCRVRISCCCNDVMPQIKEDEPTSVIWVMGRRILLNSAESFAWSFAKEQLIDVPSGLPLVILPIKKLVALQRGRQRCGSEDDSEIWALKSSPQHMSSLSGRAGEKKESGTDLWPQFCQSLWYKADRKLIERIAMT